MTYSRRIGRASRSIQPAAPSLTCSTACLKHVATHRSDTLAWQNSHALEGDLADAIRALKQQDGANLLTHGSGDMVRQLLAAGLVDERRP